MTMMRLPVIAILIGALCSGASADASSGDPARPPAPGTDVIADLSKNVETGKIKLAFDPNGPGFLKSLLRQLNVEESSQILVFSKTSLQHKLIGPKTPRAIYFGDPVAIGSVQGSALLELMVPTPAHGYAFYTMENSTPWPRRGSTWPRRGRTFTPSCVSVRGWVRKHCRQRRRTKTQASSLHSSAV